MTTPPPGWYPDPSGKRGQRYWDGQEWRWAASQSASQKWLIVGAAALVLVMLVAVVSAIESGNTSGNDQAEDTATVLPTAARTPPPVAPVDERPPELIDGIFLLSLKYEGIQVHDSEAAINLGKTVCAEMYDPTTTLKGIATAIARNSPYGLEQAGFIVGVAINSYCPEFRSRVIHLGP